MGSNADYEKAYQLKKASKGLCRDCNRPRKDTSSYCIQCSEKKIKYNRNYNDRIRFGNNRITVLKRDGYKCVKCGMTDAEHRKRWNLSITVDHINGLGCHSPVKDNRLENLQTLCLFCHAEKDTPPALFCKYGHPLKGENIVMSGLRKRCRICRTIDYKKRCWKKCIGGPSHQRTATCNAPRPS